MNKTSAVQTIGILTSGGDAPGMNAALRAVARTAWARGIDVKGIYRGYSGLLNDEIFDMQKEFTCDIISRGGTALFTARCEEFKQLEYQEKAAEILRSHNIDGLVVIGGDGSFRGAQKLSAQGINTVALPGTIDLDIACTEHGFPAIGLPGTIDNDIVGTDFTIGFDTAVNTAMQAIDKIRDSSTSHERCSIIEVMGRNAGYIALWCGIASGAEDILIPERFDGNRPKLENELIESILEKKALGKKHHLIINAEGVGHSYGMAKRIEQATGVETRASILGHMQRGGNPTAKDRVYASYMGALAVDLLCSGATNRVVGYRNGQYIDYDIEDALGMAKDVDQYEFEIAQILGR